MKKRATITFEYDNFLTSFDSQKQFEHAVKDSEAILGVVCATKYLHGYDPDTVKVEVEVVKTPAEEMAEELCRAFYGYEESHDAYLKKSALPICEKWLAKNA